MCDPEPEVTDTVTVPRARLNAIVGMVNKSWREAGARGNYCCRGDLEEIGNAIEELLEEK